MPQSNKTKDDEERSEKEIDTTLHTTHFDLQTIIRHQHKRSKYC